MLNVVGGRVTLARSPGLAEVATMPDTNQKKPGHAPGSFFPRLALAALARSGTAEAIIDASLPDEHFLVDVEAPRIIWKLPPDVVLAESDVVVFDLERPIR